MRRYVIEFIEKCVFYAFIFLIPLQTRRIFYFWGNEFNEWTAVSLYAMDILALALFVFWARRIIAGVGKIKLAGVDYFLFAFLVWSGISVFFAANFYLGVYHWVKLAEMVFLFFYTRQFLALNKKNGSVLVVWIWVVSAFTQSIVAIAQFFKQGDLGLRIFHESPIGALIDGVAKIDIDGLKIVRAYGLFPHPNLLAAFLGIAIFGCYWLWLFDSPSSPLPVPQILRDGERRTVRLNEERKSKIKSCVLWFMLSVIFTGLFLTFSRSAIALVVVLSFVFLIFSYFSNAELNQKKEIGKLILFVILCLTFLFVLLQPLLISRFNIDIGEQAVNLRVMYNKVAFDFIKKSPVFGVGIGNFVYEFKLNFGDMEFWQYQPVHNLYLLIAAETGIFGLVLFLGFIGLLSRGIFLIGYTNNPKSKAFIFYFLFSIFYFLLLGFADHYFWTLQQGALMMWVVFGILYPFILKKCDE